MENNYSGIKNQELREFLDDIENKIYDIVVDRAGYDDDEKTWEEVENEFLQKLEEVY